MTPILAIIPARGGSKGVPKKNIRALAEKPLLAYTIEEALRSGRINRTLVSSDDEEIVEVAKRWGAEAPFVRPAELAEDDVQDFPVCEHTLQWLRNREGYAPDIIVWLRPTSPLRTAQHIDEAVEALVNCPQADSVRSVCAAPKHPYKMWKIEDGHLVPFIPVTLSGLTEPYNFPRQKLPPAFVQNGAVDVIRTRTIIEKQSMTGGIILPYVMKESESVNIDTQIDFTLAEVLMEKNRRV